MHRLVTDRRGLVWKVRSRVEWRAAPGLEFEVDETSRRASVAVGSVLGLLTVLLLVSAPVNLRYPSWALGPLLLAAGLGAAWWLTQRTVVVDAAPLDPRAGQLPWSQAAPGAWQGWRLHGAVVGSLVRRGHPDPGHLRPGSGER